MKRYCNYLILLVVLICPGLLIAQKQTIYDSTITVAIPDRDTVYARNDAFQTLKRQLLVDAIKDQLGMVIYEEHANSIMRHKDIKTSELISAYQILQEYAIGEKFTMKLQGTIRLDVLNEVLRKMNLVLKDDPWYNITLAVSNNLKIPYQLLQKKLEAYHIKIANRVDFDQNSIPVDAHDSVEFAAELYNQFPNKQILFLVENEKNIESDLVTGVRVRIFRKDDFKQINSFVVKFKNAVDQTHINQELNKIVSRFISAFSIQTCKRYLYNEGLESFIDIEVAGLISPFERYEFERYVINKNKGIQSYFLKNISNEAIDYELYSNFSNKRLIEYFNTKNEAFDLIVEENELDKIKLYAIYKLEQDVTELDSWPYNNRVVEKINTILNNSEEIDEALIPEIMEKEPNNNSRQFNFLPNETLLIGKISDRGDEDIYQIEEPLEDMASINIEWMRASKTSLSPQLKLYDGEFRFLNSYSLLGRQNRIKFSYSFQAEAPKRIFIRVSDAVGFIQGETGGYKSYDYLLKVEWKP